MMLSPKHEPEWAVVDRREVQPVWTIRDDDSIEEIHTGQELVGSYVFDMKGGFQSRRALEFARKQIIRKANQMDCNVLIREAWSLTMLQRGQACRIEIVYRARPAHSPYLSGASTPPFLDYLPK